MCTLCTCWYTVRLINDDCFIYDHDFMNDVALKVRSMCTLKYTYHCNCRNLQLSYVCNCVPFSCIYGPMQAYTCIRSCSCACFGQSRNVLEIWTYNFINKASLLLQLATVITAANAIAPCALQLHADPTQKPIV